ncbi:glycopeptide, partial [Collybia nuda]
LIAAVVGAQAESHTIHFDNRCGFGKPTLISGDKILSTGGDFTIDGPLKLAIAYAKWPCNCGLQGENCTLIETTLINPTSPGTGSGTDISLIPPHAFSGPASFMYYNGCDGKGVKCNPTCNGAAHNPSDPFLQTICLVNDVNLAITFC